MTPLGGYVLTVLVTCMPAEALAKEGYLILDTSRCQARAVRLRPDPVHHRFLRRARGAQA
jgi:hypothetical protein